MLKYRVFLLPILMVCLFVQPYCVHCFAQMRTMTQLADQASDESCAMDVGALPSGTQSLCTKKTACATPKIDLTRFPCLLSLVQPLPVAERITFCFPSVDSDTLLGPPPHCPAWLRLSVLLI